MEALLFKEPISLKVKVMLAALTIPKMWNDSNMIKIQSHSHKF